eukprot:scaffold12976_cov158-Skeletonema_marinoi.AAC.1
MGHQKLLIASLTSKYTTWCLMCVGVHLHRPHQATYDDSNADTTNKCLSRAKDASILSWS